MPTAAAMALLCFISSNPSPQHWVVSGRAEAVAQMDALASATGGVRRIAHAEDGDTAFSRYELGANPSNAILYPLLARANRDNLLVSRFQHVVPGCPSGERAEVGDRRSNLMIALLAPATAIRKLGIAFNRAPAPVLLGDGRSGFGFALRSVDRGAYDELVRRAASATLNGIELVLLRPQGAAPPAPEQGRRTDIDERGS